MLFVYLVLLPPFLLTLLAWRAGLHASPTPDESGIAIRARTWPVLLFLAGPVFAILGIVLLRRAHAAPPAAASAIAWILLIGAFSSVAALITSTWAPRRVRALALFASAGWVVCFGLALAAISALRGLR